MGWYWYNIDPDGTPTLLNDSASWFYLGADGIHMPKVAPIEGRTPYIDGATLRGKYAPPREVVLLLAVKQSTAALLETALRTRQALISPGKITDASTQWFQLQRIDLSGNVRNLKGLWLYLDPKGDGPCYADVTHVFRASNPWWFNPSQQSAVYTSDPGGTSFPESWPQHWPLTLADTRLYPNNAGDVETWPTLRITGPADSPTIENETTGKTLAITQSQDLGDYIDIDMEAGTVVWYDASASASSSILANISAASEFWSLARGVNTIHVTASGVGASSITLYWYNRYTSP